MFSSAHNLNSKVYNNTFQLKLSKIQTIYFQKQHFCFYCCTGRFVVLKEGNTNLILYISMDGPTLLRGEKLSTAVKL